MYSSVWSEKDLLRIATSGISTLGLILCGIFSKEFFKLFGLCVVVSTLVRNTEKGEMSRPTELYPSNLALISVVPPPQKGSKTVLPFDTPNKGNTLETSLLPNLCLKAYQLNGGIL